MLIKVVLKALMQNQKQVQAACPAQVDRHKKQRPLQVNQASQKQNHQAVSEIVNPLLPVVSVAENKVTI